MARVNLGFGWMRLPLKSDNDADIDREQVCAMVDEFLAAGFNYFDTSFVYHGGKSEDAIKECLVNRYDRDKFILTSKLPIFTITNEEQVSDIFAKQLENCGVDYFNYFLLHNMNIIRYEREVKQCHMFEHMRQWKDEGKIKHIGFSFHDSADVLDKILSEHPEVEVVQIVVNYFDWESTFIQSRKCYEVIRKHNKKVLIMEPVKGGMLAKAPTAAENLFKGANPNASISSWAMRFAGRLDGILAVISGMSDLSQVKDNIATMQDVKPLSESELELLQKAVKIYRESGPAKMSDFSAYEAINPKGISAAAVLETWNSCLLQKVPTFAAEENYFSTEKAKRHLAMDAPCFTEPILLADGTDVTQQVKTAEKFLHDTMFFKYAI